MSALDAVDSEHLSKLRRILPQVTSFSWSTRAFNISTLLTSTTSSSAKDI